MKRAIGFGVADARLRLLRSLRQCVGTLRLRCAYAMLYAMFFVMSFALVRGYNDPPFAAGLRLTIIPIVLGLIAPFSSAASDKHPRLVMLTGAAFAAGAALALIEVLSGSPDSLPGVMILLAGFGAGLGLYITPGNSTTMAAAPAAQSAEAGGLLNLLRVLGSGIGIASASLVLAFRLATAVGVPFRTTGAPSALLFAAVRDTLVMLAAFSTLAAIMVVIRNLPTKGNKLSNIKAEKG